MNSAFGVEHGEVSKALAMPRMPKLTTPGPKHAANKAGILKPLGQQIGAGLSGAGAKAGAAGAARPGTRRGGFSSNIGQRLSSLGAKASANPGAAGSMAVGAAGIGAAGAGGSMYGSSRKKQRGY